MTEQALSLEVDRHHGRADNGPHAHAVPTRLGPVAHAPQAFLIDIHASVLRVRPQRGTTRGDEVEALPPVVLLHLAVGMGLGQHRPNLLGLKSISHRERAQPLDQDIPTQDDRGFGFNFSMGNGLA